MIENINDDVAKALSGPVTKAQAASLDVSLKILNDTSLECERLKAGMMGRLGALVSCIIVAGALHLWSATMQASLVAILVTLVIGSLLAAWNWRSSRRCVKVAEGSLKEEIDRLPT